MDGNTKAIVRAIVFGSFVVAATVAFTGRHQITGGGSGDSTYIVRDAWTGSSWREQVGRR